MSFPLFTKRLHIQPLAITDVSSFVRYRRDPVIARFQGWETTYSEEDAIRLIESQIGVTIPEKGDWLQLGIHHRDTEVLVGDLGLHSIADDEPIFEMGFTIAREHQAQGYATEAATALINHLFAKVGAAKIIATTDRRNCPSISALLALGFSRDPSRCWTENFKGEEVEMDYFEKFEHPSHRFSHSNS